MAANAFLKGSIDVMTDRELVAYWNILQYPGIKSDETRARDEEHLTAVGELLSEREIPHARGRRTELFAEWHRP